MAQEPHEALDMAMIEIGILLPVIGEWLNYTQPAENNAVKTQHVLAAEDTLRRLKEIAKELDIPVEIIKQGFGE